MNFYSSAQQGKEEGGRSVGLFLAGLVAGLAVALTINSFSQPYLGIRATASRQEVHAAANGCDFPTYTSCDDTTVSPNLYAGYRFRAWAVEAGGGPLGYRSAHNVSSSFDITQDISTRHLYVAGLRHFGSFHVLAGLARVDMQNHEYGWNDPSKQFVEQSNRSSTIQPIFGLGARYAIDEKFALRADILRIQHVARSHWTGSSDVTAIALSFQVTL